MSDSRHIRLNSRWYRIAEDAEGDGYHIRREPLRIPNAQVVKGTSGQFQLRPDLMQWSISNWAEGEGQLKFDPAQPGRSSLLVNVDPFREPGNLRLGPLVGTLAPTKEMTFTQAMGGVYSILINPELASVYSFNSSVNVLTFTHTNAAVNGAIPGGVCGDSNYLYYVAAATDSVYRYDGATFVLLNNRMQHSSTQMNLVEMGNYLYAYIPQTGLVFELSKTTINTTTDEVAIYDFSASGGNAAAHNRASSYMVAGDNRIYVMQVLSGDTIVHEIVPTSASATGYGREMGRYPGIKGHGLVWFGGFLLLLAASGDRSEVFYLQPDGALGTMGEVRSHIGDGPANDVLGSGKSTLRYVSFIGPNWATDVPGLFLVDTISGGFAQIATFPAGTISGKVEQIEDTWLVPLRDTDAAYYTDTDKYTSTGFATTPYFDFDLADEKVLREITVTCEPVPTGGSILVEYDLGDGTFTTAGTLTTVGAEGATYVVSTDSATKTFRHMAVRLTLGTSAPKSSPVVRSVEVRASVVKYVNVWDMLLDLSDDHPQYGRAGANDAEELLALSENTVYALEDAYRSHVEGSDTEYDVELDSLDISLSQPGEGVAHVILREAS